MLQVALILMAVASGRLWLVVNANGLDDLVDSFCSDPEAAKLTNKWQIIDLADAMDLGLGSGCSEQLKRATVGLKQLIAGHETDEQKSVCSQERINSLRDYHVEFIEPGKIPNSLRNFTVAYATQVAGVCRHQIDRLISTDMHKVLNPHDRDLLYRWASDGSLTSRIIPKPEDNYSTFSMPRQFVSSLRNHLKSVKKDEDKFYLQVKNANLFRDLQMRCLRRFSPIYRQVFLPAVTLADLGYHLEARDGPEDVGPAGDSSAGPQPALIDLYKWYRMVLLCETVKNIHFVGYPRADGTPPKACILPRIAALRLDGHLLGHDQKYDTIRTLTYSPAEPIEPLPDKLVDQAKSTQFSSVVRLDADHDDDWPVSPIQLELFGGSTKSRNVNLLIWALNKARLDELRAELKLTGNRGRS